MWRSGCSDVAKPTLAQIRGQNYVLAVLATDIVEERVRHGEILAPAWYVKAWQYASYYCERVRVQSR